MLAEAKRRVREALLGFRRNDDHGNDFLRTQFLVDHPDWRLGTEQRRGKGAMDFGRDVPAWAKLGWVDFVAVSEFLFERGDLPIGQWKQAIPTIPVYGGIECTKGGGRENLTANEYRQAALALKQAGADGIYLFNFFTSREEGANAYEPPFEVLRSLAQHESSAPVFEPVHPGSGLASSL